MAKKTQKTLNLIMKKTAFYSCLFIIKFIFNSTSTFWWARPKSNGAL